MSHRLRSLYHIINDDLPKGEAKATLLEFATMANWWLDENHPITAKEIIGESLASSSSLASASSSSEATKEDKNTGKFTIPGKSSKRKKPPRRTRTLASSPSQASQAPAC